MIAKAIDICEDATRFIKAVIAFILSSFAVGLAFQAKREFNDMMHMITKHTGVVAFLSNFFTCGFAFMYIVNVGAMVYTLLGLACIRNCIFRERVNQTTAVGRCCPSCVGNRCRIIQCVLGPCCATYQQAMVCISLCTQVLLSYAYLGMAILLNFLLGMCKGGNAVVTSFQGFLDKYHSYNSYQAGSFSPMNWLMNLDVEKYCDATRNTNSAAMQCFFGCILSVASQSLMLMVISEEKGRIEGTMADGDLTAISDKPRGKRRGNSSSSSSSSSDSEPERSYHDPLKQYKDPHYNPHNYKLPGGYNPGDVRTYR